MRRLAVFALGWIAASALSANTYTVTSTADAGAGTLRQAILDANGHAGADTITFAIAGTGVKTITPASPFPTIADALTIDGYTQSGASANTNGTNLGLNAVLRVEIAGSAIGTDNNCLTVSASGVAIRGLAINGCPGADVSITSAGAGALIAGNFIGTNAAGTSSPANLSTYGVQIDGADGVVLGGTAAADRNLLSGANSHDFICTLSGCPNAVIRGNLVGTNAAGTGRINSNNSEGNLVIAGAAVQIGGATASARNVFVVPLQLGGYTQNGDFVAGSKVQGNFFGLSVSGTTPVPCYGNCLSVYNQNTLIGGAAAGEGNLIGGPAGNAGLNIEADHTVVRGNAIGTDFGGTLNLGVKNMAIRVAASDVTIGGVTAGEANTIAFNGDWAGILVVGQRVTIRGNRIYGNPGTATSQGLGIDLFDFALGVTPNDAGDADTGANGLQNFPKITSFNATGASGTLNSMPSSTFTLDFYASPACDASGYGEGRTYLGSKSVSTDSGGDVSFSASLTVPSGQVVTATATDSSGNTSEFSQCASLLAARLDADAAVGGASDQNGVFEPGETAVLTPYWKNLTIVQTSANGTASGLTGPGGAGYSLVDAQAKYAAVFPEQANHCGANCYTIQVTDPAVRPAAHWDATFTETLDAFLSTPKSWKVHLGDSFTDVPRTETFYKKIETVFHNGIALGCTPTQYCPTDLVARSQMGIFLARGIAGGGGGIPASGSVGGKAYNCAPGGASLFTDVAPIDIFCKHVHYIAAQNVTLGCDAARFCPSGNVSRIEMAAFIAKSIKAPAGGAAIPQSYGPDPVTGLSYSCNPSSPSGLFSDVPASDPFCKHVHYLRATGVIAGCSGGSYCPTQSVRRNEMAKFLSNAFALELNGP